MRVFVFALGSWIFRVECWTLRIKFGLLPREWLLKVIQKTLDVRPPDTSGPSAVNVTCGIAALGCGFCSLGVSPMSSNLGISSMI